MSDEHTCETPLMELARLVPKDFRGQWETQWFEDGTPCGHAMTPIGRYIHDLADEIERLTVENKRLREALSGIDISGHIGPCTNDIYFEGEQTSFILCNNCRAREALVSEGTATKDQ